MFKKSLSPGQSLFELGIPMLVRVVKPVIHYTAQSFELVDQSQA